MKKAWTTVVALAAAAGASAQQTYVEGAYGVTQARVDCSDLTTCDKSGQGLKLVMGYQLSPQVSVEGGYLKLGRTGGTYEVLPNVIASGHADTDAYYVGGALRLPLDTHLPNVELVLRAGMARVQTKAVASVEALGVRTDDSATTWRPLLGVALRYNLSPDLGLIAGLDVTRSARLQDTDSAQVRLFSLGLNYSFDLKSLWPAGGNVFWGNGAAAEGNSGGKANKGPQPNYVYAELGVVHSDGLDVLKHNNPGVFEFEDNPTGGRLGLGRRWGAIWSTELALTNYGEYKFHTSPGLSPRTEGSVAAAGVAVMSVWRAPTDMGLTWVTRLGLSHNTSHIETSGGINRTDDRRTTAPIVGLGLEHTLDKDWRLMLTADATRIRVGDDRPLVKFYAAGGSFRF